VALYSLIVLMCR